MGRLVLSCIPPLSSFMPLLGRRRARRGSTPSSVTPRGRLPQGPVQMQETLSDSDPDCYALRHSCGARPQFLAGNACALCEGSQLRPGDCRHHRRRPSEGGEAAIHPWDDILAPDELSIAHNTLGDELRMLD